MDYIDSNEFYADEPFVHCFQPIEVLEIETYDLNETDLNVHLKNILHI